MGYRGAKLAEMFPDAPARKAARRMAREGGRHMTALAKENTPVKTGALRASWKTKPLTESVAAVGARVRVYSSGTETDVEYAPYLEYGTGLWGPKHAPYVILPKKPGGMLHWINAAGEDVFARKVVHPGIKPRWILSRTVGDLIAEWPVYLEPAAKAFELEMMALLTRLAAKSVAQVHRP